MNIVLVDDSAVIRSILREVFENALGFEVVAEASNGEKGVEVVQQYRPDLVIMDMNMPVMNGLEATRKIMADCPVPVCIFSNDVDSDLTVQALGAGALDAIRKPELDRFNDKAFLQDFLARLTQLAAVQIKRSAAVAAGPGVKAGSAVIKAVVIGASTGGPAALKEVLCRIPRDFPVGIALVQHIEDRFDKSFADWLNGQTELDVRLAGDGERFEPGTVLIAPGGKHLRCREGLLYLDDGPRVGNQKPAVDVLFESAAGWFGQNLLAVLLTGMGADGASGSELVKNRGGHTVVQDEASCAVYGMPRAAIERGAASVVLPLLEIPEYLRAYVGKI